MPFCHKNSYEKNNKKYGLFETKHATVALCNADKKACISSSRGFVTVEAAIALSLFVLFFGMLLSFFVILKNQTETYSKLDSISEKLALVPISGENPTLDIDIFGQGISEDEQSVEIKKTDIEMVAFLPEKLGAFAFTNRIIRNKWVGRIIKEDEECGDEVYVYVTDNREVYHVDENCTHLKLTISPTSLSKLEGLRNVYGSKYKPCEKCKASGDTVYISPEGDKYHGDINCSGLKRTVHKVKLSDISLPPCERCGGKREK